jgi:hypothetical protein
MVLHHSHHPVLDALRQLGLAVAWLAALVAGTALLMAAFAGPNDTALVGADGRPLTRADVLMQSSTEQALVAQPKTTVAGLTPISNERRGF